MRFKLHLLILSAQYARVTLGQETKTFCCTALWNAGLGERLINSSSSIQAYQDDVQQYFSQTAQLSPHCFFQPQDTTEVSRAIKALVAANDTQPCLFAIRSGGHTHFPGAASITDGITFDLGLLNNITYHAENSSASVGPGAIWGDVYNYLDNLGVMVVGGRSSTIGVGGLTLGGGNSYYAARYGLACDNVLRFEVVLGDGSIVTASKDERPDLFQALKGGSNNFGVVTRFDLATFDNGPGGKIWGGVVTYPMSTVEQQLEAFLAFGNNIEQDPYGSAILISAYVAATKSPPFFMDVLDYTKPNASRASASTAFASFFAIPGNTSDSTGERNMTDLVQEFEIPRGDRVSFSTLTFKNDIRVLQKAHDSFLRVQVKLAAEATGDWAIHMLYQPIPTLFAQLGLRGGGNVLGLDRFPDNLIMYEPYLSWQGAEQDVLFQSQARWLRDEISMFAKSFDADNDWLYLNYADQDQHPLEGYGAANVAKMRAVASKYDTNGVFQTMVPGGFKISAVQDKRKTKRHAGTIAGSVLGGVAGLIIACIAVSSLWRKKKPNVAEMTPMVKGVYPLPPTARIREKGKEELTSSKMNS